MPTFFRPNKSQGLSVPAVSQTYQFNCLPFGLSCAPWVFTKIIKPVATTLRNIGIRLIVYIDDMLIMAETESLSAIKARFNKIHPL